MKYNRNDDNNKHYKEMAQMYIGINNNACNPELCKTIIKDNERKVGPLSEETLLEWNKDRLKQYPDDDYISPYRNMDYFVSPFDNKSSYVLDIIENL